MKISSVIVELVRVWSRIGDADVRIADYTPGNRAIHTIQYDADQESALIWLADKEKKKEAR